MAPVCCSGFSRAPAGEGAGGWRLARVATGEGGGWHLVLVYPTSLAAVGTLHDASGWLVARYSGLVMEYLFPRFLRESLYLAQRVGGESLLPTIVKVLQTKQRLLGRGHCNTPQIYIFVCVLQILFCR